MVLTTTIATAQHFTSVRGLALGAYTAAASDISAIDWNPAALTSIRDWEISSTGYFQPHVSSRTLTFHNAGAGKKFSGNHAAAIRLSPGLNLEFIVPSTFTVEDSNATVTTQFDKRIAYREQFAFGYAFRMSDNFSLGVSTHFLEEEVTDTEYSIDTNNVIHSGPVEYTGNSWSVDWGALWRPDEHWTVGAVAKNLFRITESSLPADMDEFALRIPKTVRAGVTYRGMEKLPLSVDGDFEKRFRAGAEWTVVDPVVLSGGLHLEGRSGGGAEAFSGGASYSIANMEVAVGGIFFLDQEGRRGSADISSFQGSGVEGIEYNSYSGDRVALSLKLNIGRTAEQLARIEYVEMLSDIYPSSANVYAFRPLGRARVKNISPLPIEATVGFNVDRIMDGPTQTKPQRLEPGETAEIPFYAVLNQVVRGITSMVVSEGEVYVSAIPTGEREDSYPARVLVRGRNAWNGDVTLLRYFVTPEDPAMFSFVRSVLNDAGPGLDTTGALKRKLEQARILFESLSGRLLYVNDPSSTQDHVQYPSETLSLRGGDCDDLSVLYASMLSSVGIPTAFVDVVPPDHPDSAHIYLMFDTGIPAEEAGLISDNPKSYVIRGPANGGSTAWIPVETTLTRRGFEKAWRFAAEEYHRDANIGFGIVKGWVRIIDYETDF
jgi:hypothetical protein